MYRQNNTLQNFHQAPLPPCCSFSPPEFDSEMDGGDSSRNILSRYKIEKRLGIGTFGKVKLAVHALTGIKVAMKILDRRSINNCEAEKVRREINIMRRLSHPNVVRLFEVIETPSKVYVVMEYINSGELYYYLIEKGGRLDDDESRRLFQQIISGVEHCHRHLVVHRDLKPENLIMDSENNVKIADFGLGNITRDGHFLKTCCGSPNYAAPELLSRKLYAGPEVDVWSCGVILYALLCGRLPFDDDNIPILYSKIKIGVYSIPNHLSENARDLISRILVVDPMKRISIPEIRTHPWFRKNLPPYIAMSSLGGFSTRDNKIDIDAVKKMVEMGFDVREVVGSVQNRLQNEATVTYSILQHGRSQRHVDAYDCNPETQEHMDNVQTCTQSICPDQQNNNWTLGFKSQASPHQTMLDVLGIFHSLNVRWKRIGNYNMKCLWLPLRSNDAVKFEIQLYKETEEFYVVDLQQLSGSPFLFLNICASFRALVV
ncbi:hypothetical protein ABFS83_10G153400 [Erythranthe nasuta]